MISSTASAAYAAPTTEEQDISPATRELPESGAMDCNVASTPSAASWRRLTDLSILILGRLSIVLAALVSVRLMTTVLSPAQVGRYSVVTTFSLWFSLTLVSPAGIYIQRRFLDWVSEGTLWHELRRYAGLLLLIACITGVASLVARATGLLNISIGTTNLILCTAGYLLFLTVNSATATFLNLLGRRGLYVIYTSATAWIGMGCSAALTLLVHHSAELWIIGQTAGWALISIASYLSLRRSVTSVRIRTQAEPAQQDPWSFVWPLIISTSVYWFQIQGYRIELEHWISVSAIGLLTAGLMLGANPVTIIDTLLGDYLRPHYLRAIACNDRDLQEIAWSEMAAIFISALIPVAVLVGFSGGLLSVLLVGPSFRSVAGLVAWGVLLEFLRAVNSLYVLAAYTRFQTRSTLGPAIAGAVIVLVAIVPLARWNLYAGTGSALALGMAGSTVYLALSLRPSFHTVLPHRKVIKACAASLPVALGLVTAQLVIRHPSPLQAVVILALAGVVTLGLGIHTTYLKPFVFPLKQKATLNHT